jgi:hypothetical protein
MTELRCSFCGATAVVGDSGENAGGWHLAVVVPAAAYVRGDARPPILHQWVLCPQCSDAADSQAASAASKGPR